MEKITLIGLDLGKNSFHIHGQNHHGKAISRKNLRGLNCFSFWLIS